jgi:ferredoxin
MYDYSYLRNGESLSIRGDSCVGCGDCVEVCPHGVIEIVDAKAEIRNRSLCMECGACSRNCPSGAITVTAGVGCAAAIIIGKLTGKEPSCDCGSGSSCCG